MVVYQDTGMLIEDHTTLVYLMPGVVSRVIKIPRGGLKRRMLALLINGGSGSRESLHY